MQAQMPIYTRETQKQGHPLPLPGGGAVANNTLVKVVKIILKIITLVLIKDQLTILALIKQPP